MKNFIITSAVCIAMILSFRIKHGATNHYRVRQSAEPARR